MASYKILTPFLGLFFCCLLQGCDFGKREKELQRKAAELQQREQTLLLREATVRLKEEALAERVRALDSTAGDTTGRDSAFRHNTSLVGNWAVQMTCTETTCPGSAVGDTKAEHWEVSYQDSDIIAKALVGKALIRVYRGAYSGNTLELVENRAATASQPAARMTVRLRVLSDRQMEGEREIERADDCKIIYALQMNKLRSASH